MDFTPIFNAAIVLIAAIITTVIVPFIKTKTTAEQQKQLEILANIAVTAAEQKLGAKKGAEKKEYALGVLADKGVDETKAEPLVQSAVYQLNKTATE